MSDMGGERDTRTTTRWAPEELAWLEGEAARVGARVGSVVRGVVRAAMVDSGVASAALVSVGGGAAPVSPSGAAPRVGRRVRLDVVVARLLCPGGGPIAPVSLARARRLVAGGGVDVSGRGREGLVPDLLVGPGEVVLVDE